MAKIKTLKDYNNEIIYPQSTTKAIVNAEGVNLDTLHSKFVMMEQISEIEDIDTEYENIANKTTIINNTSTNAQYPSAKAVYDFVLANKEVGVKIEVAETKPIENIDSNTIYLIKNNNGTSENIYEEWIYTNSMWEYIGNTEVDLTNYATKEYVNSKHRNFAITIPTTGWSNTAPYSITIAIEGILSTDIPLIGVVSTDETVKEAWNNISRIITNDGSIVVYANKTIPTVEIPIQIKC